MADYSVISKALTQKLTKEEKKNNGIYFTPPACVRKNLEILQPYMAAVATVLEPSCGSCEYITALHAAFPAVHITGIEYNETIYKSILPLKNAKVNLLNADYLTQQFKTKYDLIIGNPPYFVIKKSDVGKEYHDYFEGRPNIFILFIIKSLKLLNNNGILSFVLPKNFLNCLYYDKTRKYIAAHFQILDIIDCSDKYIETQQETIILVLRLATTLVASPYVFQSGSNSAAPTIFGTTDTLLKITALYKNSKTLADLGFKVSVGTVVWNQCKDILTDDATQTRLIYSSDIANNELIFKKYSNEAKKNYIKKKGTKRPMIVVNRGYGVGEYKFNYCLIDDGKQEYLVENHLICIESQNTTLTHSQLISAYKKIIASLMDTRTSDFVNVYFGNNAINTTELATILPIYQDI
jgi:adenine-specific DNA-methyltransferase